MAGEISRVRLLIADPAGASQVFDDQTIQDILDAHEYDEGTYDAYAAAADLLEMWAAREKLSFDVDADGARFKRSQKAAMLLELAQTYRRQQRTTIIQQVRDDVIV
jgi:hypothetical protein